MLTMTALLLMAALPSQAQSGSAPSGQRARYSSSAQPAAVEIASTDDHEPMMAAAVAKTSSDEAHAAPSVAGGAAPTRETGPFRSWRVEGVANTLGAGFNLSTTIARHFDIRGGANLVGFGYEFDVDGLHYDSRIKLRSGNLRLDWFPRKGNFHISPGIAYANNYVNAPSHVPAGERFTLGDEDFVNSVSDPVHGQASLTFPRRVSPMLTMGFRNILPGQHRHISVPLEFGVVYTGAPTIDVSLAGTACQQDGCFTFEDNAEAQQSLRDEVRDINDTLSNVPVYPVLSLGFGYRF
ncbi:hypothetical protein JAO29_08660 [Edaphobacter sp. HDX4]|uniref:hypothetical protein n=1 Tax=Edaphobacter sp. HDX4 TaxID=2794064 RepID=UPI002FE5E2E2